MRFGDGAEETELALVVSGGDAGRVDAIDRTEVLVVGAPVRNLFVEQLLKLRRKPRGGVDAVGDGVDLVVRGTSAGRPCRAAWRRR